MDSKSKIITFPRILQAPSVIVLFLWMIVPLVMTLYFSFSRYNLLYPDQSGFEGVLNYEFFLTDEGFFPAIYNTLVLVGNILLITVVVGLLFALLINRPFIGRGVVRVMLISPFFIMPTVNALLWKNMFMHPVYGLFAYISSIFGLPVVSWLTDLPLFSIVIILSWQWTPFALLIFMTALQSHDPSQKEAAEIDGAGSIQQFFYLILPHLARPIAIVVMIQTIFHLSIFAEIYITTAGGPGYDSTNLAFMIFSQGFLGNDVGIASAGGIIAIVLANIVAFFLIRMIGKNLTA